MSEETHAQLRRCVNRGRYVDLLVRDQQIRWQRALALLQKTGWRAGELYAARVLAAECAEHTHPSRLRTILRTGTERALREWGVEGIHWTTQLRTLSNRECARALLIVVRESWAGNHDVSHAIEEGESRG